MSRGNGSIRDKVAALREAGLARDEAAGEGDPISRLSARINAAQDKDRKLTVRFTATQGWRDELDYMAAQANYSRGGFIKFCCNLVLEQLGAQIEDLDKGDDD